MIDLGALGELGHRLVAHPWWAILLSGIPAGWMMGRLSWLVIGLCHLHHSIVGSAEVLVAVFARQGVTLSGYGVFLAWATAGNIVGGVFFVGLLKYSHIMRVGEGKAPVHLEDMPGGERK